MRTGTTKKCGPALGKASAPSAREVCDAVGKWILSSTDTLLIILSRAEKTERALARVEGKLDQLLKDHGLYTGRTRGMMPIPKRDPGPREEPKARKGSRR